MSFFQAICLVYSTIAFRVDAMTFRHTYYSSSFSYAKKGSWDRGLGCGGGRSGINSQLKSVLLMAVFHVILSSKNTTAM